MLRIAIVGCGKIADTHASLIQTIKGCEIVGVCDSEPLMARQLYERFPVKQYFGDLKELLWQTEPDVVHITTPPESHFGIAKFCLESGCHVYVEKPFTVCEEEAQKLIALANERSLKLTVGHDAQFNHAARRMRTLVHSGFLGDGLVHMESYYCYELGQAYARALLGDARHWVRRLPGKLLHNVISHGIARIAEFLTNDSPQVIAYGANGFGLPPRRRVIICEEERVSAYFTFSSQMRPSIHQFRIYGTKNGLVLDHDQETLITLRGARFKSYAENFVPAVMLAKQYLGNVATNLRAFVTRDLHMKSGMRYLIQSFYDSIIENAPAPIPYREILLTARIMDAIFVQMEEGHATVPAQHLLRLDAPLTK